MLQNERLCWTLGAAYVLKVKLSLLGLVDFPSSSVGKESACNAGDPNEFLGREDPFEKGWATDSRILGLPLWLSW